MEFLGIDTIIVTRAGVEDQFFADLIPGENENSITPVRFEKQVG